MGLYFLIGSLFPVALLILCIVTMVRGLTFPGRVRGARRPVCGRCGHEIAERYAGADRCPECGSRYDVAGTMTVYLAKRTRPGGLAVGAAWTVVMLAVSGIASTVIAVAPMQGASLTRSQQQAGFRAIRTDGSVDTSVPGYRVEFDMSIDYRGSGPTESGSMTLTIVTDVGVTQIAVIDLPTKAWRATGPAAAGSPNNAGGVFDRDAALALLASAGVDTGMPYAVREAEILSDSVDLLAASPQHALRGDLGMTRQHQPVNQPPPAPRWMPKTIQSRGSSSSTSGGDQTWSFDFDDGSSLGTNASFDGTIEFAVTGGSLDRVTVRVRDVAGGTGVLRYNPVTGDTEIIGLAGNVRVNAPGPRAAFTELAAALALGTRGAGLVDDLSDITATMVKNPAHFVQQPARARPSGVRDGEPDGGFQAGGSGGSTMPVRGLRGASVVLLGGYAAMLVVYAVGLVLIWRRRRAMQRIAMAEHAPLQTAVSSA